MPSPSFDPPRNGLLPSLIHRIAGGQRDALRMLYEATAELAYRSARRVLEDCALAEDAVAETYLQVWRAPQRYDAARGTVSGWIAMIARARALDQRRRQRGIDAIPLEPELEGVEGSNVEALVGPVVEAAQVSERAEFVRKALLGLPQKQRVAVECAFFHGLTHVQAAARLGEPLGTTKARIKAGLESLRFTLEPLGLEPMGGPRRRSGAAPNEQVLISDQRSGEATG